MNPSPTNFTEDSLADQIFLGSDDAETEGVELSKDAGRLKPNELVGHGDFMTAGDLKPEGRACQNSLPKNHKNLTITTTSIIFSALVIAGGVVLASPGLNFLMPGKPLQFLGFYLVAGGLMVTSGVLLWRLTSKGA